MLRRSGGLAADLPLSICWPTIGSPRPFARLDRDKPQRHPTLGTLTRQPEQPSPPL